MFKILLAFQEKKLRFTTRKLYYRGLNNWNRLWGRLYFHLIIIRNPETPTFLLSPVTTVLASDICPHGPRNPILKIEASTATLLYFHLIRIRNPETPF